MGAEHPIMQENLPVERLVRKALRAEEPIGRPGIRQLGIPQGAKRLEEHVLFSQFYIKKPPNNCNCLNIPQQLISQFSLANDR